MTKQVRTAGALGLALTLLLIVYGGYWLWMLRALCPARVPHSHA